MLRLTLRKAIMGLALAATAVAGTASQAEAGWWGHGTWGSHGSGGSSGGGRHQSYWGNHWGGRSWHSNYGTWGSSGGYSSGGWGSRGGSNYGGWSSSGGSSGGYGYYGGSSGGSSYYGGWSSSGGSSGGHYGGYSVAPSTVVGPSEAPSPAAGDRHPSVPSTDEGMGPNDGAGTLDDNSPTGRPFMPENGDSTFYTPSSDSALVSVSVPAGAKVFVNGIATSSTGSYRQYVSRGLKTGQRYGYEVSAEIVRDGQSLTETKTVELVGGQEADLAFTFAGDENRQASVEQKTTLIVRVPADAKLYLAGQETRAVGETREFTTSKLSSENAWANYPIRVVAQIDGRTVTKEQTISLRAGESREVTIDFSSVEVASK